MFRSYSNDEIVVNACIILFSSVFMVYSTGNCWILPPLNTEHSARYSAQGYWYWPNANAVCGATFNIAYLIRIREHPKRYFVFIRNMFQNDIKRFLSIIFLGCNSSRLFVNDNYKLYLTFLLSSDKLGLRLYPQSYKKWQWHLLWIKKGVYDWYSDYNPCLRHNIARWRWETRNSSVF